MRSLNKVILIGNLTRDAELRKTSAGNSVTSFSLATNRGWTTESGEKKEETEFHKIVTWNKLADICAQFGQKGKKLYIEGRLSTRQWKDKEGNEKATTEIIADDVIFLDSRVNDNLRGGEENNGRTNTNDNG